MPAETEPHRSTLMAWPPDVPQCIYTPDQLEPARLAYARVVRAIAPVRAGDARRASRRSRERGRAGRHRGGHRRVADRRRLDARRRPDRRARARRRGRTPCTSASTPGVTSSSRTTRMRGSAETSRAGSVCRCTRRRWCSRAGRSRSTAGVRSSPPSGASSTRTGIPAGAGPTSRRALERFLGADRVVWLADAIAEDDGTDGHVDNVVAFTSVRRGAPAGLRRAREPQRGDRTRQRAAPACRGIRRGRDARASLRRRRRATCGGALREPVRGERLRRRTGERAPVRRRRVPARRPALLRARSCSRCRGRYSRTAGAACTASRSRCPREGVHRIRRAAFPGARPRARTRAVARRPRAVGVASRRGRARPRRRRRRARRGGRRRAASCACPS